jgi:hypothetical protein
MKASSRYERAGFKRVFRVKRTTDSWNLTDHDPLNSANPLFFCKAGLESPGQPLAALKQ